MTVYSFSFLKEVCFTDSGKCYTHAYIRNIKISWSPYWNHSILLCKKALKTLRATHHLDLEALVISVNVSSQFSADMLKLPQTSNKSARAECGEFPDKCGVLWSVTDEVSQEEAQRCIKNFK